MGKLYVVICCRDGTLEHYKKDAHGRYEISVSGRSLAGVESWFEGIIANNQLSSYHLCGPPFY
jgi:hypothetical protein